MIYGIVEEQDESHIKIGYASSRNEDVDAQAAVRRVKQYQTGNRRDLYVVCGVPGTVGDEKKLHKQFAKQWEGGEWFTVDAQVKAWIDSCRLAAPVRVRKQKTPRMIQEAIVEQAQPIAPAPAPTENMWRGSYKYGCLECSQPCALCTCATPLPTRLNPGQWVWRGQVRGRMSASTIIAANDTARPSKAVRELDELARVSREIKARNQNSTSPYARASARCWWPTGKVG